MKVLIYSKFKYDFVDEILYRGFSDLLHEGSLYIYAPNSMYIPRYMNGLRKDRFVEGDEIFDRIDEFDLIIFCNTSLFDRNFSKVMSRETNIKRVFMDAVDDFFIRRIYLHKNLDYYFKREAYNYMSINDRFEWGAKYMYVRAWLYAKRIVNPLSIYDIPFAIALKRRFKNLKVFNLTTTAVNRNELNFNRNIPLSFVGMYNNRFRKMDADCAANFCKSAGLNNCFIRNSKKDRVKDLDYKKILGRSKIGLSLRGIGYDTFRYWEIPSNGAALLSRRLPIIIKNDFTDEQNALFFSSYEELDTKISKYLIKSDEWREIAKAGRTHFLRYHTPKERAKHILSEIAE